MRTLGLDIGTHSVKAVLLKTGFFGMRVLDTVQRPVRGDDPVHVAQVLLEELVGDADVIVWSLNRKLLATREIHLPFSQAAQIDQAFPYAAEGHIPMPIHEAMVDYRIDGEDPTGGTRVTVFAYPKKAFNARMEAFAPLVQHRATYHIDAFANLNVLVAQHQQTTSSGQIVGLLDVGATKSSLDLIINGVPKFTRTFLTAGTNVNEAIAREFEIDIDEAETMKVESLSRDVSVDEERVVSQRLMKAITPIYQRLAQNVRHSLRAFHERHPNLRLACLYLSGGSAQAPFLQEFLSDHLGVECKLLEPQALVKQCKRTNQAPVKFSSAFGLALWGAGQGVVKVDFLRESVPPLLLRSSNIAIVALGIFLFCALHFLGLSNRLEKLTEHSHELHRLIDQQVANLSKSPIKVPARSLSLKQLDEAITKAKELTSSLHRQGSSSLSILDAIAQLILQTRKDEILIDTITIHREKVQLSGRADSYDTLDVLKLAIEESKFFGTVSFGPMNNRNVSGPKRLKFQLKFQVESRKES